MHNLIFNLILPCEVENKFNLINYLVNKTFEFITPCTTDYVFEYETNNHIIQLITPCEVNNTFTYIDLTDLVFEYSCSNISFSTIYFITADNEYFELKEAKLLTVQKPK